MNLRVFLLPGLVVVVGVVAWQFSAPPPTTLPALTWRSGKGTEVQQGQNFVKLAPESPVQLSLHTAEPIHLTVWSHSSEDGTLQLFPTAGLETNRKNPLPAGQSVLPGTFGDKELAWTTRSGILATTTYVAIASREPLPELTQLADRVRSWSNSVFPDRSMQVTKPAGTANLLGAPREPWASPLLQRAADQLRDQTEPNGPMTPFADRDGVWISVWKVLQTR